MVLVIITATQAVIFCANVKLTWKIEEANIEIIKEFQLYKTSLFEDIVYIGKSMNFLDLTILRPFTKYEIWMRLVRDEEETVRSSERITVTTDGRLPSDTCIKSVKKISEDGILLAWARPTEVYNTVDYYYVRFRFGSGFGTQQLFADCETG